MILAFHSFQITTYGGSTGMRDEAALESALARPQNRELYDEDADNFDLASEYGYGIAKNHPFVDGNKRVAFVGMVVFLLENGWFLDVEEPDAVLVMRALASGDLPQDGLASWLRKACVERPRD